MQPADATYEQIESLISETQVKEGAVHCTFRCPATEKTVAAQMDIARANSDSLKSKMKVRAKQTVLQSMTRQVSMLVRRIAGNGVVGQLANDVVRHTASAAAKSDTFSEAEKQNAVLVAFQSRAANQFQWDAERKAFVHVSYGDKKPETAQSAADQAGTALTASLLLGTMFFAFAQTVTAQEAIIYTVGGDKAAGKALASANGGKWSKSPTKAFKNAAKKLASGGEMNVTIRIAAGTYEGDLGSGAFTMPKFRNKEARLNIVGGYTKDFAQRDAFGTPTRFSANAGRSQPLIKFHISTPRNQDELRALVIDGIVMDVAGSNKYDKKTNSLLKGSSCSFVVINFGYLKTDLLEITNCVVMNSAHRAFETLVRPATPKAEIRLVNNLFLNCVIPVKLDSPRGRFSPAKITVDHCSFLLNWAYNPDPNTSNPAALELGPNYAAKEIHITNNLFYSNFGGAILALHKKLPELTITGNNFIGNGLLHGKTEGAAVAMIVEASGRKQDIDVATIEEIDAVEDAEDNVSMAPGIPLALSEVQVVDASKVQVDDSWENQARSILGLNLRGGKVDIKDYAPRKTYDAKNPPVPGVDAAKRYGFSTEPGKAEPH